jgi:nickel-dependent lactate racemase
LKQIFGKYLQQIKPQLIFHDAHYSEMIHLGKTRFGNDVFVNQVITQADGIITINSVEPHYFAGFTGGRKSILPGIAGYKTIEYNHRLALKKGVGNAMLQGNPVHLDMEEGVSMIQIPIFSIQLVQDWTDKICFLSFGDIRYSFYQAVEVARNIFTIKIDTKADIVIAEVESPLNRNLYQAHKALENCRSLLKQGGIFILMASCHEGIGNARFVETLNAYDKLSDVMKNCELNYKLGDHKAFRIASFLQHSKLLLVSEMNENVLQHSSFENYPDLQTAMQNALKHSTNNPRVIHVKQAGTISVLAE